MHSYRSVILFFFFNDTATTEIYTLSLHDALPICLLVLENPALRPGALRTGAVQVPPLRDRKSTRLNSSHQIISYAVFCLKKKTHTKPHILDYHRVRDSRQLR